MKRLGAIDKVLLFLLVPIWGFWFAISLYNLAHDRIGVLPIVVSAPTIANPYPVVRGFQYEPWGNLKIGDRLLRIGREDLRGVWPIGLFSRVQKEMDPRLRVSIVFDRDGQRHQELVTLFQVPFPWQATPVTVLYTVLAILLIIRAPASRLIRVVFVVLMADAFLEVFYCFAPIGLFAVNYAWAAVAFACMVVGGPLSLTAVILFPEHIGSTNAHLPKWPWFFAVAGPIE